MIQDEKLRAHKKWPKAALLMGVFALLIGSALWGFFAAIRFVTHAASTAHATPAPITPVAALTSAPGIPLPDDTQPPTPIPRIRPQRPLIFIPPAPVHSPTASPSTPGPQPPAQLQPQPQQVAPQHRVYMSDMKFEDRDAAQDRQAVADLKSAGYETPSPVDASYIRPSRYQISEHDFLTVKLDIDVNSELPGEVTGTITLPVFSSTDHTTLLIPQGSQIVGDDSRADIHNGQGKLAVDWRSIIFPNQIQKVISNGESADLMGAAGVNGHVDTHQGKILGQFALYTLINAVGNALGRVQYLSGAGIGLPFVDQAQSIRPTITIPANTTIHVYARTAIPMLPWSEVEKMAR